MIKSQDEHTKSAEMIDLQVKTLLFKHDAQPPLANKDFTLQFNQFYLFQKLMNKKLIVFIVKRCSPLPCIYSL